MSSGIYQIRNIINGKRYIGSAINLKGRLENHSFALKGNYHRNIYLQNAWNKYGEDNFVFEILIYCNKEDLIDKEQKRINHYKTAEGKGYNICKVAGSRLGMKHTSEVKRKISKSKIGCKHSEETKRKIGISNYGRKHSEETKRKMGIIHIGNTNFLNRHHSEETKRKMSFTKKGKPSLRKGISLSEETKIKMSNAKKGNQYHLGKFHSEETKQKISATKRRLKLIA